MRHRISWVAVIAAAAMIILVLGLARACNTPEPSAPVQGYEETQPAEETAAPALLREDAVPEETSLPPTGGPG